MKSPVARHMNTFNKPSVVLSKKSTLLRSAELQDMEEMALEEAVEANKCDVELMSDEEE